MSNYTTLTALLGKLPLAHITDACDDDKDGALDADVVETLCANASRKVDSFLERRYPCPLSAADFENETLPGIVTEAALLFALVDVYQRRGVELPQALKDDVKRVTDLLTAIGSGEEPLVPEIAQTSGVGVAITECVKINASMG